MAFLTLFWLLLIFHLLTITKFAGVTNQIKIRFHDYIIFWVKFVFREKFVHIEK